MNMDENLRKIFEETAEALTGKTVILRFSDPLARNARGECWKSGDGIIRININPRRSVKEVYEIALHEIAHAKLDNPQPLSVGQYALTANLDARKVNKEPAYKPAHDAAQELADRWNARAVEAGKNSIRWFMSDENRAVILMTALKTLSKLGEI